MKTSIITRAAILLSVLPLTIKAQVAPELSRNFPANIIAKIYDVTLKAKLPLQKQIRLGWYFKTQDSLANASLLKGEPASEIKKYYEVKPEILSKVLSPLELNDYEIDKDNAASKFAVAIKYRIELALTQVQINSLFNQFEQEKKLVKKIGFDIKRYEADHLVLIMKKEQYRALLLMINREKAQDYAIEIWKQGKELGLTDGTDSVSVIPELLRYHNNNVTSTEYTNTTGDLDKNIGSIPKPPLLQKIDVVNGNVEEKELAAAVKYKTELNLNYRQVNAIINYAIQLENWRALTKSKNPNASTDTKAAEIKSLLKMLQSEQQYTKLLTLKNTDKAIKNARADWVDLQKFDLIAGLDSAKTNTQNLKYETEILVEVEKMAIIGTPEKADSVKKTLAANRPYILLKLAAYRNNLPKSQFSEAIKYRKELKLNDNQINQLLDKVSKLELLKLDNKSHHLYEFTRVKEFETYNLISILNEVQYSIYLTYKVHNKSVEYANSDWEKLKKFGLSKDLDSAKVYIQIMKYETDQLVANERYLNDKSQINLFFKKQLEDNKPDYLKKMDAAVKNLTANNEVKKNLAW